MDRETMSSDVRYALGQLLGCRAIAGGWEAMDRVLRAIDALERVEAGLAGPTDAEAFAYAHMDPTPGREGEWAQHFGNVEPGSERGLPCDTGLQDQIGERQYDYGCYGT